MAPESSANGARDQLKKIMDQIVAAQRSAAAYNAKDLTSESENKRQITHLDDSIDSDEVDTEEVNDYVEMETPVEK